MAIPPLNPPSVKKTSGVGFMSSLPIVGDVINAASSWIGNIVNRKRALKDYEREKQDRLDFWNMQNAYNHPSAQRQRLEEAGLNPNLVYGGSSGGTAGTASNVGAPTIADPSPVQFEARAPFELSRYFDNSLKRAQTNNVGAQTDVNKAMVDKIRAETVRTLFDSDLKKHERDFFLQTMGLRGKLLETNLQAKEQAIRAGEQDMVFQANEEARKAARHEQSLTLGLQAIDRNAFENSLQPIMRERALGELQKLQYNNDILAVEAEMAQDKIFGDSMFEIILAGLIHGLTNGGTAEDLGRSLRKWWNGQKKTDLKTRSAIRDALRSIFFPGF